MFGSRSSFSNGPNLHTHKRHFEDSNDFERHVKRRLVENLTGLSIGSDHQSAFDNKNFKNRNTLFGNFLPEQLQKASRDPNKVYIKNIDQFLKENPDQLDLIGKSINLGDLRKQGLDNLFVSCGLDLNKAWDKIVAQYKSEDYESKDVEDQIYKLIWEDYLAKYFSLIQYYDPLKVVWERFVEWLKKNRRPMFNNPNITELDNDGDDIMIEDDMAIDDDTNNNNNVLEDTDFVIDADEMDDLASREQSLRDGMSSYGSYYNHDDDGNWNERSCSQTNFFNNGIIQPQSIMVNTDDDVMMED
ncbi:hypothetical protein CANINC_000740 [Pichia inconspicua]|uniref:Uncharacterized protein n=1 Tax=Pichia inconspicua TaxID=52247 RepID=A0A4T0X5U8_9ASCO|nr:hypothetical protein CANINC_000740 [[Candida] inconspicua]